VRQMACILVDIILWLHQLFLRIAHLQDYTVQYVMSVLVTRFVTNSCQLW